MGPSTLSSLKTKLYSTEAYIQYLFNQLFSLFQEIKSITMYDDENFFSKFDDPWKPTQLTDKYIVIEI